MPDLPEPMTPADCDLRGYDFMPLFGHRLFRSELYELSNGEEFKVAVKLWWEAWNQCPAGSLPFDDVKLCRLADLGRDIKLWKKMRASVLRGFVLCSDGRLYHRLLCEWALDAFARRVKDRERKRRWRDGKGDGTPPSGPGTGARDETRTETGTSTTRDGDKAEIPRHVRVVSRMRGEDRTGEERKKEDNNLSSLGNPRDLRPDFGTARGPVLPEKPAIPAAVDALVGRVTRNLRGIAYAPGQSPKRSVVEQINALSGQQAGEARGPVEPIRTPEEQLAILRGEQAA